MRLFGDRRKLFGLYFVLIVVPSLLLATLYIQALEREYEGDLAALPLEAREGARRLEHAMTARVQALFSEENERPFKHFARRHAVGSAPGVLVTEPSPLTTERLPRGLAGWVAIETTREGAGSITVFDGRSELPDDEIAMLYRATGSFLRALLQSDPLDRIVEFVDARRDRVPATVLGTLLLGENEIDRLCLAEFAHLLADSWYGVTITELRPRLFRDLDGLPRVLSTRRVLVTSPPEGEVQLPEGAPCVTDLAREFHLIQGFFLDLEWLTRTLPFELAENLSLAGPLRELEPGAPEPDVVVRPLELLGIELAPHWRNFGALAIDVDDSQVRSRYVASRRRLQGLGLMLLLSISSGILLLYRRVRIEIEQARRSEDFLAAVTHELRTPLSTIRLHGEMLVEGWTDDADLQHAYHERILAETARLSGMVERILQTSRLKQRGGGAPAPLDLNRLVESVGRQLEQPGQPLEFELAPDLPRVLATPEELESILRNLVENARKYAPVAADGEPILVRTRERDGAVLLEVLDRGPGVPAQERETIFEAFYRMGREHRRETQGTGLGLHLVRLAAQRLGGWAEFAPREGGGSNFRVRLRVTTKD
ncbi:MAG: ATP-binding protein [Planctomycetota bacterium]